MEKGDMVNTAVNITGGKVRRRVWTHDGKRRESWGWTLTVDGKQTRRQGWDSKVEAQDALDAFKKELRNPKPAVEVRPTLTLSEAFSRFLDLKARKKTLRQYQKTAKHLKAYFGDDTQLSEITAERIGAYKAERLAMKRGENKDHALSAAAVNRPLALLRHLLRLARKWKVLAEVPDIELEREPQGRLRWLKPEDAQRLLAECKASRNTALADLVEFTMFTGLRQGEALRLTWESVDRARGVIRVEETKTGYRREVPLSANADAVLARRWSEDAKGYVFGSRNWNSFRSAWERAVDAAGLADFRFHDLRHTFASWLVQRGRTLKEVQDALGHRTLAMTMRYAHLSPDHLRTAVSALDGVLSLPEKAQTEHKNEKPADSLAGSREERLLLQ